MHFELTKTYLDNLVNILDQEDADAAKNLIDDLHAVDIADLYDELNIEQAKFLFFQISDGEKAADVIAELDDDDRERFLKAIPSEVIANKFIHFMDSDDAADVMADLSVKKQTEVLENVLDMNRAGNILDLLAFDEDSAGGLMGKEYVSVNWNSGINDAISVIRTKAEEVDEVFYVYVVDDDNVLKGALSLKKLLLSAKDKIIKDIMTVNLVMIPAEMHAAEVSNIADKYDLVALPVVDIKKRLLGRITIDDIVDFLREEADKDYQMISGISDDVEASDSVWKLTKARLPWLLIGLLGGIMGAQVIGLYEVDLQEHATMAFFIPLIAAMGGNVGVQSSSIVVQAIAKNTQRMETTFKKITKELSVALLNGLICSAIVFSYNLLFSDSMALTLTVSIALLSVILLASIFGTFVPLLLDKYKIDPALATGPFITTANDIIGLLIYLAIGGVMFAII